MEKMCIRDSTVGHAFESMALAENRPVLHGYAVAWGIVCELYLSHLKVGFPKEKMRQTIQFIKDNYGVFTFDCKKYEQLYAFMTHDKKNTSGTINFTLLKDIGDSRINQIADKDTIFEMLDFYRECTVSYTHLDVYKRQADISLLLQYIINLKTDCCRITFKETLSNLCIPDKFISVHTGIPRAAAGIVRDIGRQ